ncbi:putative major capsid protein [Methanosarcina spherical virus]|nr:hypothetical protein [Methanosarcina spherical virus]WKN02309.1 hypothetical protein HCCKFEEG_00015 [Methanosarcina spherical virus]WKN02329.1 hypothetical protein OBGAJBEG_00013 [Methanosarcina spherical virus]WKN02351.1 hypothetical protein FJIADALF_00015 [Methanosarcina spherical virus]
MAATDAGDIRIVKTDASETVRQVLYETGSEIAVLGGSDPRLAPIVPMSQATLREDDKILVEYKTGTASQITGTSCSARIPIRRKNVRTGNVAESFLRSSDVFARGVTAIAANGWVTIGSYTVPAQEEIRLGQSIAENSRLYFNLVE